MRYNNLAAQKSRFLDLEPYAKQIDLTYIESVCLGDSTMMIRLIESFMKNIDEFTFNARLAVAEKNWHGVYESCHKIKATINSFGLNRLKVPISRLEERVLSLTELESIDLLLDKCVRLFESAKLELCSKLEALKLNPDGDSFTS